MQTEKAFRDAVVTELQEVLKGHDDACRFILAFFNYAHGIDDLVDEEKSVPTVRKTTALMEATLSSAFYRQYADYLYPVLRMVHFTYFLSADWEQGESWQREHADVLRHCGNDLAVAVVSLFQNDDVTLAFAKSLRTLSHRYHHEFEQEVF